MCRRGVAPDSGQCPRHKATRPRDRGSISLKSISPSGGCIGRAGWRAFRRPAGEGIPPGIYTVFFSDAGGGIDRAGIARLADLDQKGIVAGTTSAEQRPDR